MHWIDFYDCLKHNNFFDMDKCTNIHVFMYTKFIWIEFEGEMIKRRELDNGRNPSLEKKNNGVRMKGLDQSFLHEFFVSKIHYQRKTVFFPRWLTRIRYALLKWNGYLISSTHISLYYSYETIGCIHTYATYSDWPSNGRTVGIILFLNPPEEIYSLCRLREAIEVQKNCTVCPRSLDAFDI